MKYPILPRIRSATEKDGTALFKLSVAVHRENYAQFIPKESRAAFDLSYSLTAESQRRFLEWHSTHTTKPKGDTLIAELQDGSIAGSIRVTYVDSVSARIVGIFVLPSLQGKGIGKALLMSLLATLEHTIVELFVIENNTVAIRMYEAIGFRKIDAVTKQFYGAKMQRMVLTLS